MSKIRWGVLSTANIAQKALLPAFSRSDNAEVTAIASGSDITKAERIAEKFGIPTAYDGYDKLLDDSNIDAVYIPLPNHLHKQWVIEAAKKGKHILCEKPAAINSNDVLEMKKVCDEHGVLFMEAFMYYFHSQHNRVKEIIDSGEIGEVKLMRAAFSFYLAKKENNIRMSNQKGGGSIYDIGCYGIHSIRNILRTEPNTVQVHGAVDPAYGVETDAVGYMTFPNGVRAIFDSSFNMAHRSEYEVVGTEGRIKVPRAYRPDNNGGDGLVVVEKGNVQRTETVNCDQYRSQVEHLSQAIIDKKTQVYHDFNNTINNMRVIDACYESIKQGRLIELS
ncbi:Predicted dehydrogenase [Virgibacillus subterraneus]|uniref:Predicted dehydrogenase n=1 Tax=Virgibacillus subterraneus TaxID=621109 RepID=A0A1H9AY64_9BACI|nr:Gfo/Idh/MocA family oxidoreductase [Virgibacillus subterraneus]SEP81684.1 Predicted dehydrogenase [Virgibacillus subterraneus]